MAESRAARIIRSNAFTIGLVILVELSGYVFENHKEVVPWLVDVELKSHAGLSRLVALARKPRVERVVTVEIDDETYFNDWGDPGVTPRNKLAQIALTAADADAAVIALDINLSADPNEDSRRDANRCLLEAICKITERGIPVVLTSGLPKEGKPREKWWERQTTISTWEPSIYDDSALPNFGHMTRVGFDNGPNDPRQIPLLVTAPEPNGQLKSRRSFALEIVDAYEDAIHMTPKRKTLDNPDINKAINDGDFVYGSFLKSDELGRCLDHTSGEFPCVSARDLVEGRSPFVRAFDQETKTEDKSEAREKPKQESNINKVGERQSTRGGIVPPGSKSAKDGRKRHERTETHATKKSNASEIMEKLKHRIVIIGGNRHKEYKRGDWVDDHKSPVGNMRGLYFHANYVEALLDDRVRVPVRPWFGLLFNLVLAVLLIFFFKKAERPWGRWAVLGVFFVPWLVAYFMFVNFKYSLDFVLPLGLLFLKLFLEHYFHLRRLAKIGREALQHAH